MYNSFVEELNCTFKALILENLDKTLIQLLIILFSLILLKS